MLHLYTKIRIICILQVVYFTISTMTDRTWRSKIQSYDYILDAFADDWLEYKVVSPEWYIIVVWAMDWYDKETDWWNKDNVTSIWNKRNEAIDKTSYFIFENSLWQFTFADSNWYDMKFISQSWVDNFYVNTNWNKRPSI
jgi:hypothetical protein